MGNTTPTTAPVVSLGAFHIQVKSMEHGARLLAAVAENSVAFLKWNYSSTKCFYSVDEEAKVELFGATNIGDPSAEKHAKLSEAAELEARAAKLREEAQ